MKSPRLDTGGDLDETAGTRPSDVTAVSVAAIVIAGDTVLVARRKPGGDLGGLWEFPGGKREQGESEPDAVERELAEEFGARARVGRELGRSTFVHDGRNYDLIAFEAELLCGVAYLAEHDEVAYVRASELDGLDFAPSDRGLFACIKRRLSGG